MELDRFEDLPGLTITARAPDEPAAQDDDESFEIDVGRVVWDQDYRRRVMEELKRRRDRETSETDRPPEVPKQPAAPAA